MNDWLNESCLDLLEMAEPDLEDEENLDNTITVFEGQDSIIDSSTKPRPPSAASTLFCMSPEERALVIDDDFMTAPSSGYCQGQQPLSSSVTPPPPQPFAYPQSLDYPPTFGSSSVSPAPQPSPGGPDQAGGWLCQEDLSSHLYGRVLPCFSGQFDGHQSDVRQGAAGETADPDISTGFLPPPPSYEGRPSEFLLPRPASNPPVTSYIPCSATAQVGRSRARHVACDSGEITESNHSGRSNAPARYQENFLTQSLSLPNLPIFSTNALSTSSAAVDGDGASTSGEPVLPPDPFSPPPPRASSASPLPLQRPLPSGDPGQLLSAAEAEIEIDKLDPRLAKAARASLETGTMTPLIKEELRLSILNRRHSRGQDEPNVRFSPPRHYELRPEEEEKRDKRRNMNKVAAKKHREKKKAEQQDLQEEYQSLLQRNEHLKQEVRNLEAERAAFLSVFNASPPP